MHIFTVATATSPCQSLFQWASIRLVSRDVYHVPTLSHSWIFSLCDFHQTASEICNFNILFCISLIGNEEKHIFIPGLVVHISLFVNCLFLFFVSLSLFKKNLILKSSSYVLHTNFLVTYAVNNFSQSVTSKNICWQFICDMKVYNFSIVKCFHLWTSGFHESLISKLFIQGKCHFFPSTLVICFYV